MNTKKYSKPEMEVISITLDSPIAAPSNPEEIDLPMVTFPNED